MLLKGVFEGDGWLGVACLFLTLNVDQPRVCEGVADGRKCEGMTALKRSSVVPRPLICSHFTPRISGDAEGERLVVAGSGVQHQPLHGCGRRGDARSSAGGLGRALLLLYEVFTARARCFNPLHLLPSSASVSVLLFSKKVHAHLCGDTPLGVSCFSSSSSPFASKLSATVSMYTAFFPTPGRGGGGQAGDDAGRGRRAAHRAGEGMVRQAPEAKERGDPLPRDAGQPQGGHAVAAARHHAHQEHAVAPPPGQVR